MVALRSVDKRSDLDENVAEKSAESVTEEIFNLFKEKFELNTFESPVSMCVKFFDRNPLANVLIRVVDYFLDEV